MSRIRQRFLSEAPRYSLALCHVTHLTHTALSMLQVGDVDHIMNCTSTGCNSEDQIRSEIPRLFKIVDAHRSSPALLSWYICDDCPCGGDTASDAKRHALSFVYSLLKERDPYHITSGAGGCGNMYSLGEPYALSLDQVSTAVQSLLQRTDNYRCIQECRSSPFVII